MSVMDNRMRMMRTKLEITSMIMKVSIFIILFYHLIEHQFDKTATTLFIYNLNILELFFLFSSCSIDSYTNGSKKFKQNNVNARENRGVNVNINLNINLNIGDNDNNKSSNGNSNINDNSNLDSVTDARNDSNNNNNNLITIIGTYFISYLRWVFILWSFGCPFSQKFGKINHLIFSFLSILSCSQIIKNQTKKQFQIPNERNTDTLDYTEEIENKTVMHKFYKLNFRVITPDLIPQPSFLLFFLAFSSAIYLLDWGEKFQNWPIPTLIGAFFGAIFDDIFALLLSS